MFKTRFMITQLMVAGLCFPLTAETKAEAVAMVKQAIEFAKAQGKEAALAEISKPGGQFTKGSLYIFVYDLNGVVRAHGQSPQNVGKNMLEAMDPAGAFYVKERIITAKAQGEGWQIYKFSNPITKQVESKTAFVELYDELIFGCGVYK
jgi:signal transduction histidine kinase